MAYYTAEALSGESALVRRTSGTVPLDLLGALDGLLGLPAPLR